MPPLPSNAPSWLVLLTVVVGVLVYVVKFLSEASESFAKILGPLGRRLRRRGEDRAAERVDTDPRRVSAMKAERDFHEAQSRAFEKRATAAELENHEFMDWYRECDQPFHREVAISSAEKGYDTPEWVPFSQWLERRKPN